MFNLPTTGRNAQRASFYREVAAGFNLLAVYYNLTAEKQQELLEFILYLEGTNRDENR